MRYREQHDPPIAEPGPASAGLRPAGEAHGGERAYERVPEHIDEAVRYGECGAVNRTRHEVFLAWFGDVLHVLAERDMDFALWNFRGRFGILDSERDDVDQVDRHGHAPGPSHPHRLRISSTLRIFLIGLIRSHQR